MRSPITSGLLILLALNTAWFVWYSARLAVQGVASDLPDEVPRVFQGDVVFVNSAMALHMVAGAVLTIGAPLQALPVLRRRWPHWHRRIGYALFGLAMLTGFGGLFYIAANGTVGGQWMDFWFAVYGAAMIVSASATVYFAIRQDTSRHFAWATRLVILAVGSWIYRMHYGLWYALTGGLGSNEEFTGLFDKVQVFAFFVPYLLIAEMFLRRRRPLRAIQKTC